MLMLAQHSAASGTLGKMISMELMTIVGLILGVLGVWWCSGSFFNNVGRFASRDGKHSIARCLFWISGYIGFHRHSRVNVKYEGFLLGKVSAQEVLEALYKNGIQHTSHGKWLIEKLNHN